MQAARATLVEPLTDEPDVQEALLELVTMAFGGD